MKNTEELKMLMNREQEMSMSTDLEHHNDTAPK